MNRDTKGKFLKPKTDGDEIPEEDQIMTGKFLDRPPSVKIILFFFVLSWVFTLIFPELKEETSRRLSNYMCQVNLEKDYRGNFTNTYPPVASKEK